MADHSHRVQLPLSHREPIFGAQLVGVPHPKRRIEVTVYLRGKATPNITGGEGLARDQFTELYGALAEDVARLEEFAREYGLSVIAADRARRSVILSGTIQAFSDAFGTKLERRRWRGQVFRSRTGPLSVPADLANRIEAVLGLDTRPQAKPHFRILKLTSAVRPLKAPALKTFTPPQVASLYQFPAGSDGSGECIALIELGGGYRPKDLEVYFSKIGVKAPSVTAVSVNKGRNKPTGDPSSADAEVMLDIEVAGSIAPGAKIAVYFAPNTDRGFVDAITTAVHDQVNKPSVISISWGGPEDTWTAQARNQMDSAFQAAAALNVSVLVAAGDSGSSDGEADGVVHVDFPASSPHATGCGGTRLTASNATTIATETVWNDGPSQGATGGGVSEYFAVPSYQQGVKVPPSASTGFAGRGVPDVAGNADPLTGYTTDVDGETLIIGGTSAVAPLYAALVARLNQAKGKPIGFLNPTLYASSVIASAYRDVTQGNNGAYSARAGWDACTGWGSIIGNQLLKDESAGPATAAVPRTPARKAPSPRTPQAAAHAAAAPMARSPQAMRPAPPTRQGPPGVAAPPPRPFPPVGRPGPFRPMESKVTPHPLPWPTPARPARAQPIQPNLPHTASPPQRPPIMPARGAPARRPSPSAAMVPRQNPQALQGGAPVVAPRGPLLPPAQQRPSAGKPPQGGAAVPKPAKKPHGN
jgi:kumamolisin